MGYPQVVRDKHKQVPIFPPRLSLTHTLLASSGSWVALKIGGVRNPTPVPCPPNTNGTDPAFSRSLQSRVKSMRAENRM